MALKTAWGTTSPVFRHKAQEREMPSLDQIIVWIIVGLIGGSLAGLLVKRERKGFGLFRNLSVA